MNIIPQILEKKRPSIAFKRLLLGLPLALTLFLGTQLGQAAGGVFPKMPEAPAVEVYDLRADSIEARLSAIALQGLLNQVCAHVFLQINVNDLPWLQYSGKPHQLQTLLGGPNAGFRSLYAKNIKSADKLIVYDPAKDWTFNLALMKGALGSGLPVTASLRNSLLAEFGKNRSKISGRFGVAEWRPMDGPAPTLASV